MTAVTSEQTGLVPHVNLQFNSLLQSRVRAVPHRVFQSIVDLVPA